MTVTELSKITGYSISTVSKALSDSGEISRETKEKILRIAKETGYYNKALKRKKRIGMPQTVGIITEDVRSREIYRLTRELKSLGLVPVVCDDETALIVLTQTLGVDAVVFADGREKECSVPYAVHSGNAENTAGEILSMLNGKKSAEAKEQDKKEDIWLF